MRSLARHLGAIAMALLVWAPATAWAQDDIDAEKEAALGESEPGEAVEETPAASEEELPQIGEDQLAVFVLQRGFYFSGDLGVFMTFGGTRGYSNIQPYVAVKAGFDINDYLSVQAAFSSGYSSGNPLSNNDAGLGLGGQEVVNYNLFNLGAEVVGAIRPSTRFAIEPKAGGGLTRINPTPHDPNDPNSFVSGFAPHVVAGVDLKYLTLLTDFSAGMSLTGYFIIGPNIPAVSIGFVVRYTL
ncbi:adventurous gliding motility protein CglE [Myxococcota bacterium]